MSKSKPSGSIQIVIEYSATAGSWRAWCSIDGTKAKASAWGKSPKKAIKALTENMEFLGYKFAGEKE
jgi:hypothetical protein